LTTAPVNTKALAHLAAVAGDSLNKHLNKILTCLAQRLSQVLDSDQQAKVEIVLFITDVD